MRFGLLHEPDRGTYDRICYQMIIWVVNIIQVDSIQCTFWKWVGEISKILTTNQKKINLANLQNTNPGKEVGRGNLKFLLHVKLLIFPIIFYSHAPQTLGWGNSCVCVVSFCHVLGGFKKGICFTEWLGKVRYYWISKYCAKSNAKKKNERVRGISII